VDGRTVARRIGVRQPPVVSARHRRHALEQSAAQALDLLRNLPTNGCKLRGLVRSDGDRRAPIELVEKRSHDRNLAAKRRKHLWDPDLVGLNESSGHRHLLHE
jgi:hypothetical protein